MSKPEKRTFVVYVEDKPGVLDRVASLFRRRNYNIDSLNVGQTNEPGVSRMTIVCEADEDRARRIEANLYKLVNCVYVDDITDKASVDRVLALVKVKITPERRAEVLQISEVFRAHPVDIGPESLVLEITGSKDKVDGLVKMLEPYGIAEIAQTGTLSMTRGYTTRRVGPPTLEAELSAE